MMRGTAERMRKPQRIKDWHEHQVKKARAMKAEEDRRALDFDSLFDDDDEDDEDDKKAEPAAGSLEAGIQERLLSSIAYAEYSRIKSDKCESPTEDLQTPEFPEFPSRASSLDMGTRRTDIQEPVNRKMVVSPWTNEQADVEQRRIASSVESDTQIKGKLKRYPSLTRNLGSFGDDEEKAVETKKDIANNMSFAKDELESPEEDSSLISRGFNPINDENVSTWNDDLDHTDSDGLAQEDFMQSILDMDGQYVSPTQELESRRVDFLPHVSSPENDGSIPGRRTKVVANAPYVVVDPDIGLQGYR